MSLRSGCRQLDDYGFARNVLLALYLTFAPSPIPLVVDKTVLR